MYDSGQYGIAILFDEKTNQVIGDMADKAEKQIGDSAFNVNDEIAHITLLHGSYRNLKKKEVKNTMQKAKQTLDKQLELGEIEKFNNFVFWHTKGIPDHLYKAHKKVISFLKDHLIEKEAKKEMRNSSDLTEKQKQCLLKYGYPLVLDEWLPHISLMYKEGLTEFNSFTKEYTATIDSVAFCSFKEYGTVDEVLLTEPL